MNFRELASTVLSEALSARLSIIDKLNLSGEIKLADEVKLADQIEMSVHFHLGSQGPAAVCQLLEHSDTDSSGRPRKTETVMSGPESGTEQAVASDASPFPAELGMHFILGDSLFEMASQKEYEPFSRFQIVAAKTDTARAHYSSDRFKFYDFELSREERPTLTIWPLGIGADEGKVVVRNRRHSKTVNGAKWSCERIPSNQTFSVPNAKRTLISFDEEISVSFFVTRTSATNAQEHWLLVFPKQ